MKSALLALAFLFAAGYGHAQALPAASGPGSHVTLGGGVSWYQQDYGHRQIGGGYGFVELRPYWRCGIVGEARSLRLNTDQQVSESSYLAGVQANLRSRPARTEPYVKILAGAGRITLPFNYAHGTFLAYAAGGGVDYAVNDRWTLRVVDVEVQRWTNFPFGNLQPYGVSAGVSLRLNPMRRYPNGSSHPR